MCAGAGHDLVAGLVFCNAGTVDLSVINGEIIVQDGKLLTIDLEVCSPAPDGLQVCIIKEDQGFGKSS